MPAVPPFFKHPSRYPNLSRELPEPGAEERAHSEALIQSIRAEISQVNGSMDFRRFMELALYAPGLGYYSAGKFKFGAVGDFITAPELSPLFGRCIARQCEQIMRPLGPCDILEAGAGSGALAVELLIELEARACLPVNYFIIELGADLRERQQEHIKRRAPHLFPRVQWLDTLPISGFRGVILGNELLDSMPVQRFCVGEDGITQLIIGWQDGKFVWREQPADEAIVQRITPLELPPGYVSEINFNAEAWVASIADMLEAGVLLLIDYGFPRLEFYHPERMQGTVMCHYRHHAHGDPLILVGLQDITAHVDFTAVAEAGHQAGLEVAGYTSQADFLLATGLMEFIENSDPREARTHLHLSRQIKKLTLPSEMGELFKVIAMGRNLANEEQLLGFTRRDRRGRL
ncbi:MAG TPA: SAM-dependent methyltransferase [Acidiferrobacterales bacterium]|nr:SAM-dependent methyltransferase [Acidiferrobacterales bacterium]